MNKLRELEQVCSSCSANVKANDAVNELASPLCKEAHKVNERISIPKLNSSTSVYILNKSGENQKRIHGLLSHIDELINLIKQYKTEGFISSSVEKFIEIRNEVKEKMEAHINSAPFCDICKETIECSNNNGNLTSHASSTKCVNSTTSPNKSTENLPCSNSIYDLTDVTRSKLGCFEKKYKEIVKVKRLQNEDGSVSEEKQDITIRTEMRNPQEMSGPDSEIDEYEKYFDSSVVDGMSHGEDTLHLNLDKLNSRETKPEYATEHHQTCEPKFRTYTSAGQPKETMNEGSNVSKNSCNDPTKILKNSSADSIICCPKITPSGRGSFQSSNVIQGAIPLCKQAPTPTTDNIISIEKSAKEKRDCSLPFHLNEVTSSHDKSIKSKSISTGALWRDVWTSTTDLLSIPSKILNTKPKLILRQEAIGKEKEISKQVKQSNSCCIVKIIPKSAKLSYVQYREKPNQDPQKVVLNILDNIKKTYMPSNSTFKDPSLEVSKENRTRNICDRCKAKLNSSLLKSSLSTSKKCGVNSVKGQNAENISRYPSYSSMSCKSIGVGSANMGIREIHVCGHLSTSSISSRKCMFFLVTRNSEGSDSKTCCKMNQTTLKSVGCSTTKSNSSGCSCKKTSASVKYTPAYLKTRDVGTSTRRSTRFDVRPITRRHTRKKINLDDCTCHSDSCFFEDKVQEMVSSSRSYNDGYFYKW